MIKLGINMEFVPHHDMSFANGVKKAAEIGYEYVEPMVHLGRELLSAGKSPEHRWDAPAATELLTGSGSLILLNPPERILFSR